MKLFPDDPKILEPELWLPRSDWREPRLWRRPLKEIRMGLGFSGCCCNVTHVGCGCSGLPNTVHVTFSNSGACAALDGQSFALTWTTTASNLCSGNINPGFFLQLH